MTSERADCSAGRLACLAALICAGCAATPPEETAREYLDERTAATVTVGLQPLVFARERPELAVNARDYLTLVPVDVNRSGTHAQYFYGYVWTTLDKRGLPERESGATGFELIADGRRIPLAPLAAEPLALGLGAAPLPAPARSALVIVAPTSREVQEFVAGAAELRAVRLGESGSERYELWDR